MKKQINNPSVPIHVASFELAKSLRKNGRYLKCMAKINLDIRVAISHFIKINDNFKDKLFLGQLPMGKTKKENVPHELG